MVLFKETSLNTKSFQKRRQFWVGETSTKPKGNSTMQIEKGNEALQYRKTRLAIHALSKTMFDTTIKNFNRIY